MKKSDLKTGMRFKTRDGELYLVLKDCETYLGNHTCFVNFNGRGFNFDDNYTEELTLVQLNEVEEDGYGDVMEIYTTERGFVNGCTLDPKDLKLIWKRNEAESK